LRAASWPAACAATVPSADDSAVSSTGQAPLYSSRCGGARAGVNASSAVEACCLGPASVARVCTAPPRAGAPAGRPAPLARDGGQPRRSAGGGAGARPPRSEKLLHPSAWLLQLASPAHRMAGASARAGANMRAGAGVWRTQARGWRTGGGAFARACCCSVTQTRTF
jgi:hypothetical protein